MSLFKISWIQLKSPQGASRILFILYSLIMLTIPFLTLIVFICSDPKPDTLSLDDQKLVL